MKKTLAQFRRDIDKGVHIEYVRLAERVNCIEPDETKLIERPVPEERRGIRYVSYKDTTGFYLKKPNGPSTRGSFCGWPKAANLTYVDDSFIIQEVNKRGEVTQKRFYNIIRYL